VLIFHILHFKSICSEMTRGVRKVTTCM
jgi:hypothetical protein